MSGLTGLMAARLSYHGGCVDAQNHWVCGECDLVCLQPCHDVWRG